ncbi:hypothetical protein ACF0H5_022281 [Mactra antiquata]
MWKVRDTTISKTKYRCYSPTQMVNALLKVRETGAPIKTTARQYDVIEQHEFNKRPKTTQYNRSSQQPGTSGMSKPESTTVTRSEDVESDNDVCCVCNLFTPQEVYKSSSLIFVKWVECDECGHWVHLGFCTEVRVIRRGEKYLCPHCNLI